MRTQARTDSLIAFFGQALTRVNWMLRTARRHTRTPNLSSVARRIFWQVRISNRQGLVDSYLWFQNTLFLAVLIFDLQIEQVYKRSDQPHFNGEDINLTRGFIEAETDERRRTLMGIRGWESSWLEVDPASINPKL